MRIGSIPAVGRDYRPRDRAAQLANVRTIEAAAARVLNDGMDVPIPFPADAPESTTTPPPYVLYRPALQTVPLVFASAHSGQDYSADFMAATRLDALTLRRSEDSFVDELFSAAPANGAPLIAATFPRAYCDANREPWELDPAMFEEPLPDWVNTRSARVGAGLGTIARVVASGEPIYHRKLPFAEAERRVRVLWQPFHAALAGLLRDTLARFGRCLLVDCHSMPGTLNGPHGHADMVIGDAHGCACDARLVRLMEQALGGMGYRVRRNDPYAGGYITRHYGRPRDGVHAVQIEISRRLYMDEGLFRRSPEFPRIRSDMTALIEFLAASVSVGG